jgi:two-component system, sensor histidine kinase and response regulator
MENKVNMLLVEDDSLSVKFFVMYFSRFFEIEVADTVQKFYNAIKSETLFDIIVMDISLQDDKDGLQLTRELRATERYCDCPIVALTANVFKHDEISAFKAGVTKFLRKPIESSILLKELMEVIEKPGTVFF